MGGDESSTATDDRDPGTGANDGSTVRRFAPGDEVAIRRLYERAMRDAGTDPEDVPGTTDLDRIEAEYLDSGGEFLVVEVDGSLVAMGGLVVDGEEAELFRVAVDPDRQREGYGSRVLAGLETAARDRGVDRVVLETARRQTAATEFYPAHGYDETGRRRVDEYEIVAFAKAIPD